MIRYDLKSGDRKIIQETDMETLEKLIEIYILKLYEREIIEDKHRNDIYYYIYMYGIDEG